MNTKTIFNGWPLICRLLSIFLLLSFQADAANEQDYTEIEWVQLIPEDDLSALLNPPEYLSNIQDGSEMDNIDALSTFKDQDETVSRFEQALGSMRVIKSFDNKAVKVPGFVVPLVADEQQKVTEFFIVPYFGACLHMPPPPPNQMIYGKVSEGFELTELTTPFWFEGTIHIKSMSNLTGTSAYTMSLDNIVPYE